MKKFEVQFIDAECIDAEEPEAYYMTVEAESHQDAARVAQKLRHNQIEVIAAYEIR